MKSRNLISAAFAAVLFGSVVLAPSVAFAQRGNRDNSRSQRGPLSSRNQNRNNNRSDNNRWSNQRNNDSWNRNGDRDHDRTNDRDHDWNRNNNNNNDRDHNWNNDRDHDRDNDRDHNWDRDHDRDHDWDRDHDRDRDWNNRRRPVLVRRSYNYYSYPSYSYPSYGYGYDDHRGDEWRDIAQAAGLLAIIGLLDHDDTLFFVGAFGALYSIDRYDHDRYSRDPECRLRAEFFSRPFFYRDGRRYERETINRDGERYYRFACR